MSYIQTLRPDFLIIGVQRGGTTWLSAILNAHPNIACFPTTYFNPQKKDPGELHFFNTIASVEEPDRPFARPFDDFFSKYGGRYADIAPFKNAISCDELYRIFVKRYSDICEKERGGKDVVGETTPAYVLFLDWIDRFYPKIKKLCVLRDSKDRIVSWYFKKNIKEGGGENMRVTNDFALNYLRGRIMREYEALLSYNEQILCVTYESLQHNPIPIVRNIVEYLGFSHTANVLRHMVKDASFEKQTKRNDGVQRKAGEENNKSSMRKGITGDWKNYMSYDLADTIDREIHDLEKRVFKKYNITM